MASWKSSEFLEVAQIATCEHGGSARFRARVNPAPRCFAPAHRRELLLRVLLHLERRATWARAIRADFEKTT